VFDKEQGKYVDDDMEISLGDKSQQHAKQFTDEMENLIWIEPSIAELESVAKAIALTWYITDFGKITRAGQQALEMFENSEYRYLENRKNYSDTIPWGLVQIMIIPWNKYSLTTIRKQVSHVTTFLKTTSGTTKRYFKKQVQ
jgi:hypothetical protein